MCHFGDMLKLAQCKGQCVCSMVCGMHSTSDHALFQRRAHMLSYPAARSAFHRQAASCMATELLSS